PLLLQLPLFIVLYRLIHDLTTTVVAGALIVGGAAAGSAGTTLPATVTYQNVKVSNGSLNSKNQLSDSITADVVGPDGGVVGQLRGKVFDDVIKKDSKDPAAPIVDPKTGKEIGPPRGARAEGAKVNANPKHIPEQSQLAKDLKKT